MQEKRFYVSRWAYLVRCLLTSVMLIQAVQRVAVAEPHALENQGNHKRQGHERSTTATAARTVGTDQMSTNSSSTRTDNNDRRDNSQNSQTTHPSFQERLSRFSRAIFMPPREGAPRNTATAGSRDENWCIGDHTPMRALMPAENYGLTFAARPTIWVDMPATRAEQVVLLFQTEGGEPHAQNTLAIPASQENGMAAFQLPATTPALVVGQPYRWSLAVICGQALNPSDPLFNGWVTRTERSPQAERILTTTTPTEQISWLGSQGYWYEMVSLMLRNPELLD
ncbi:MAG: DUF928 domain-containing protein [Cyanobacteria bacterium P01_F01_bin.53]